MVLKELQSVRPEPRVFASLPINACDGFLLYFRASIETGADWMAEQDKWSDDDHWPAEDFARLYCLVYFSYANSSVNEESIAKIVSESRKSNTRQNITGLLVFGDRFFMQWLEGPKDQIEILMSRIRRDPHHTNILVLKEWEDVRERLFPDWAMERVSSEDIRDVLSKALEAAKDTGKIEALRFLLAELNTGTLASLTVH